MMDDSDTIAPLPKWPLVLALLASLLWTALAMVAVAGALGGDALVGPLRALVVAGSIVLALLAPLAVVWLVALSLRERSGLRSGRAALMARQADIAEMKLHLGAEAILTLEDRITALASRIEAIAGPVESRQAALMGVVGQFESTGARLNEASAGAIAATETLRDAIPAATATAERLTALIAATDTDLKRQIAETETLLAALHQRAAEAETQARATTDATISGMAAIVAASEAAQAAVAAPLATLRDGVEKAYVDTAAAMDATRDGVHAQTNAMLASIDQARVTLDHIGGEAARQIQERLELLVGGATRVGEAVESEAERTQSFIDDVSRSFGIFDAKLGNAANTSTTMLESIFARMTEARDAIHRLGEPIAATETALAAVELRLGSVTTSTGEALEALGTALPAALPHLDGITDRLIDLHQRTHDLSAPIETGGAAIAASTALLAEARGAMETAAEKLGAELESARAALGDIEAMTGNISLQASSQLIDVFGRVRDVANQTAGTMRETLSGVVAEAEAALDQAGSSRAEIAFATPIRASLADVEALHLKVAGTAQVAAERVTRRLLALTETIAGVEARIDEADTRFDIRARDTLAARASKLVDSLQAAAVDIVGLLAFEVEDTAWDSYLKGDRSIFARRIAQQIDQDGTRVIERHCQHDAEFRTEATHYIDGFEALIAHVLPDREGRTLANTLLSSDIGRLYVTLATAMGRFAN